MNGASERMARPLSQRSTRPGSATVLAQLATYESRNVTFMESDGSWPIVWERARGTAVWDRDGRRYLDLTAAFGVAASGHANPAVVRAGQRQMGRLLHAMGDVHPHALKAELARELSRITFERWSDALRVSGKVVLGSSGFEAVEAALKTAMLATGKPRVLAFAGAYHGLGYGALNVTHRAHFRSPFRRQLRDFADFVPFPTQPDALAGILRQVERRLKAGRIGAILTEPVQARGGIHVPPPGFLAGLRRLCDRHGALLILDEIYTGFGRTGRWFACEREGVIPDLICLGKALTGGFPLSACVGRRPLMDAAWPASTGEAIHTSTFLGHPVGCAMALAQIREIERRGLVDRSAQLGTWLAAELAAFPTQVGNLKIDVRAIGLMAGIELNNGDGKPATSAALGIIKRLLHRGYILLPEGADANVISLTPPLTISRADLRRTVAALAAALAEEGYP